MFCSNMNCIYRLPVPDFLTPNIRTWGNRFAFPEVLTGWATTGALVEFFSTRVSVKEASLIKILFWVLKVSNLSLKTTFWLPACISRDSSKLLLGVIVEVIKLITTVRNYKWWRLTSKQNIICRSQICLRTDYVSTMRGKIHVLFAWKW